MKKNEMTIFNNDEFGKSTLVQLAPRLYDPTEGSISLDGTDLKDLSLSELRHRIGYVPQQSFLFTGTIASNVAYGTEGLTDEELKRAIHLAQADDLVAASPEVRTTNVEQPITYKKGDVVKIFGRPEMDTTHDIINVSYTDFTKCVGKGAHILFDDGLLDMLVMEQVGPRWCGEICG